MLVVSETRKVYMPTILSRQKTLKSLLNIKKYKKIIKKIKLKKRIKLTN
jgi:hypothetical protein